MRKTVFMVTVVLCVVCLWSPVSAATLCGDVNGSGSITLSDFFKVVDHIAITGLPIDTVGDCDNRAGITIADMEVMTRYFFYMESTFDCTIAATYGFAPSLSDTVFLPYMSGIPEELNSVVLPVMTSFAENTRAFYIPCETYEPESPDRFRLDYVEALNENANHMSGRLGGDTAILLSTEFDEVQYPFTGRQILYNLHFTREQTGVASISCLDVIRTAVLRIAVEKGGDLYTPVVVYYEVSVPHPVVTVAPSSLAMDARSGRWSTVSYPVTMTADVLSASFKIAASDSWIVIDELSSTGYTTPAAISVRANASALDPGVYTGQITFSEIDPADAEFVPAALDVTLTVADPITFPPGDLNCDGKVTIGDISVMIDCLFIDVREIPACE